MFTVLNRLRGTEGLWSKIIGLLLALVVQIAFGNPYVSILVGLGYIIGESFGWGEWDTLALNHNAKMPTPYTEGSNNGIQWLTTKIVNPSIDWTNHCRVALTIRGFYWWFLALAPLYFVSDSLLITVSILFLSIGFPIACEIGYLLKDKDYSFWKLSYKGGLEMQEGVYGLMQDIVLLFIGVYCAI